MTHTVYNQQVLNSKVTIFVVQGGSVRTAKFNTLENFLLSINLCCWDISKLKCRDDDRVRFSTVQF